MNILNPPASTRLPSEILREIIILAYKYIPQPQEPDETELDLQLVSPPVVASHVCRSWRYGLLDDPSLWTCVLIPQFKPDGVIEILNRSGSASLNVFLVSRLGHWVKPYIYEGTLEMLSSLFQQIHRFKFLHVQINLMAYLFLPQHADFLHRSAERVLSYLQQPAPNLRTFRFWYKYGAFPLENTFSDTLFSRKASNIKHIHYQPFPDFRELKSPPLFHNLSELYLTLPGDNVELDHLFRLIELSPELKLLRVYSDWDEKAVIIHQPDSFRKINLPHLERLILEANETTELGDIILGCIVFPSNLHWHITLHGWRLTDDTPFEHSPHFVEFLSSTPFSSFHLEFGSGGFVSLAMEEENSGPQYLDQSARNKLLFAYGISDEFSIFWNTAISHTERSSRITHLDIVIEQYLEPRIFQKILRRMQNLESLTIMEKTQIRSNVDDPGLYLSILVLNPQNVATSEYNVNMGVTGATDSNPVQDPDLDMVSKNEDISSNSTSSDPFSDTFAPTAILCPLLRELTMKLGNPLDKAHALILRACFDSRRREDLDVYPLGIFVHCPGIEEGVESILGMGGDDSIHVSAVSHSEESFNIVFCVY